MAELMLVNPKKRRKAGGKKRRSVAKRTKSRSVVKSIRRRYRKNPIGGGASGAIEQFKTGAIGAAGALLTDVLILKLPLPENLKTGQFAPIFKGFVGIGLGMLIAKVGKQRDIGKKMAQGSVTVALYGAGKEMLKGPLGLGGYDDNGLLGYDGLLDGDFDDDDGMGAYENGLNAYESGGPIVQ